MGNYFPPRKASVVDDKKYLPKSQVKRRPAIIDEAIKG
jgi:hypothetical protein